MTKICNICQIEKEITLFEKNKNIKSGYTSRCLDCKSKAGKIHYLKNKHHILPRQKLYYLTAREKALDASRAYKASHKEIIKQNSAAYYANNRESIIAKRKLYFRKNSAKVKANRKLRYHKMTANSPQYKLSRNLRTRLWAALKKQNNKKSTKTFDLIGCSISYLTNYLAAKFSAGMTWENYGQWHIDHIKPCISFDLSDLQQQRECFHYTNLQPLWAADNFSKHANLDWQKSI